MKCVTVYVKGVEAGVLAKFKRGGYEFRYTRQYRETIALAEGEQKRIQCRTMRIDEDDHFTRLAETCREGAIGAVYVLPR